VRVLVVEDERKIARVLVSALEAEHYDVVVAPTGEDGFFRANAEAFDLVVLDVMLPGRSGLEILQTLRQRHIETPVLIPTARDGVDDRVLGLVSREMRRAKPGKSRAGPRRSTTSSTCR
jgi:two-component system copper resistance phosphate regulon response regulator CusR